MNCYTKLISALSLGLALSFGTTVKAQAFDIILDLGYSLTDTMGTENDPNDLLTFGIEFTPSVDLLIGGLGVYVKGGGGSFPQDDVDVARPVGLWEVGSGTLLGQVTVNPGKDICQDDFCFARLNTPINVTQNVAYRVGAFYESGQIGDKLLGFTPSQITFDPRLTLNRTSTFFSDATTLAYPEFEDDTSFRASANIVIGNIPERTEIPEPQTVGALFLLGLGALFLKKQ
ncbi:PEP-CTERM sorting domain-containing protein [Crocosphaera sp. XPORK-15E]|uniref:PEP-CTERM sorting domain-containing protein n=1 Tax=Crocosphaera sp. XPORK-15E TaxID=3110247 RepID=UPI002B1F0C02|nr:PEP-CTERM sorting domain-containing protein [Crocosphaera sp. XPORK-15E]MEA5532807.1 PEP-CTERM sorting domain-containing protein [Crocosphaera sp. XPORK-15E]